MNEAKPTRVTLREITKENFRECIALEVDAIQKNFVATNVYSLENSDETIVVPPWRP